MHSIVKPDYEPVIELSGTAVNKVLETNPAMERAMQSTQQLPDTATIGRPIGALTADALAHRKRCKSLSPIQYGEAERLIANFLATRGVTACPTRYLAPIEPRSQLARTGH
jgi:hypothetical protein